MAQLGDGAEDALRENPKPPPVVVEDFHTNDDTDARRESHHHTLGPLPTQAAPGDHTHDGGDSALLLAGVTITGDRSDGTALASVISALVRLGATDSTVA